MNLYHHRDHGTRRFNARYEAGRVTLTDVDTGEVIRSDPGPVSYCSEFCHCKRGETS